MENLLILLGLLGFIPLFRWLGRKHFELRSEAFSILECRGGRGCGHDPGCGPAPVDEPQR